jgi:hypothetical protein
MACVRLPSSPVSNPGGAGVYPRLQFWAHYSGILMEIAMTDTSPNLDLPLILPAQAQKHVTVNESLLRLDALVQARVQSRNVVSQPVDPSDGQAWLLPAGPTGAQWSVMSEASLAVWRDGFWTEIPARAGWALFVLDEAALIRFDGSDWRAAEAATILAEADNGAQTQSLIIPHRTVELAGPNIVTGAVIPARSVVFCVSVRTVAEIVGASSFDCGVSGQVSKFGGSLGIGVGSSNLGVIGPTAYYSDTPVVLTANGGGFSGGIVDIAIHVWVPKAPK